MKALAGAQPSPLNVDTGPERKEEDPRELAVRRREVERRRTGVDDLRVSPNSGQAGASLAVPN